MEQSEENVEALELDEKRNIPMARMNGLEHFFSASES